MNAIEQKFKNEIEVERLWLAIPKNNFWRLTAFIISALFVYGLWDTASHKMLLIWLALHIPLMLFESTYQGYYVKYKGAMNANITKFKSICLIVAVYQGLLWLMCVVWFLDLSNPLNVLLIGIIVNHAIVSAMMGWHSYLPIVFIVALPQALTFATLLLFQDNKVFLVVGILFILFSTFSIAGSLRLAEMLNHALRLNFENADLRKESDEKSLQLENALKETLKREQALEQARKDAEQANTAKTRFLAAASHDLRQPIHALGLFFSELSDRVYSPDTAPVIRQVEETIASINSMLNALLDVSKLDAGIIKPDFAPFALIGLFQRLQEEFRPFALESHNQLRIRPTTAVVNTDAAMLEQMLRNLVGNALRYTEKGRVMVAVRRRGKNFVIQVFDTGLGIPSDQLEEIFVEFHQLQNPARDRRQGLGLGLAIVRRLGHLLGHDIKVSSHLGRGSCFSITLPLALDPLEAKPLVLNGNGYVLNNALSGCRVLVLDDDIAILEGMKGLLSRWGCEVMTASSIAEAKQKLIGNKPQLDLLIVDYRLPENLSGIESVTILRSILGYPVAVLIISGDTSPERLREADASGFPLLHKPVQPARLRKTLQYLVTKPLVS